MTISKKIPLVFCAATAFALAHATPNNSAPALASGGAALTATTGNATIAKKDMTDAEIAEVVRKAVFDTRRLKFIFSDKPCRGQHIKKHKGDL